MRLAARRREDGCLLVIGLVKHLRIGQRGAGRWAVFAVSKANCGEGKTTAVQSQGVVEVVAHQAKNAGIGVSGLTGSGGVAVQNQGVVMVGSDHDQRVLQCRVNDFHLVDGDLDGIIKSCRVLQRFACRGFMQRVVDAASLDHQEKPLFIALQLVNRARRHVGQAGLLGWVAIQVIGHVAGREQTQQFARGRKLVEIALRSGVAVALGFHLGDQVTRVGAAASRALGQEMAQAATQNHVNTIAQRRIESDTARHHLIGNGVFTVTLANMRVGRRRRGVGDACRAHHASTHARRLCKFKQRGCRLAIGGGAG